MAGLEEVFGIPVIESYGMTEAAHQMASNPLPPRQRKPGSVGPAAGTEIAILNEAGEILGSERTGEVAIRGPNVTRGYSYNPTANALSFCSGWFRTGDQGYLDKDGYLFITGRLKELINRGGEKIAPRDIDEVLLAYPGVQQAVAFALPHRSLGEDIAAAVVLKKNITASEAELRQFAFGRLPPFKVPCRIVFVKEVPKGPTGKVQRIGLAERLRSELAVAYEAPVSNIERMVAAAISEVLNLERVGRNESFFSLGGDSLLAAQVAARLAKLVKVELPLRRFFEAATVAGLASELEQRLGTCLAAPLGPVPRTGPLPLSFAQQRLWFLDRLLPEKSTYNVPSLWRLGGQLDTQALRRSLDTLVQRHESLRTCLVVSQGEPAQVIAPPQPWPCPSLISAGLRPRSARRAPSNWLRQKPAGPSTWRRICCCEPSCCASRRRSTCCW
jgi:acyl carrier protein